MARRNSCLLAYGIALPDRYSGKKQKFRFVRKEKMHDELSEAMIAVCKKVKNELLLYEFCSGKDNIKIRVIDIIYIESSINQPVCIIFGIMDIITNFNRIIICG